MVRVVQPDGVIFVRDLLRPDSEAELSQLVQTYAGDANAHQQKILIGQATQRAAANNRKTVRAHDFIVMP